MGHSSCLRVARGWSWRGLTLAVPSRCLPPRTVLLQWRARRGDRTRRPRGLSVLDVGCGSGLLSMVATRARRMVTAIDINAEAVRATIENATANQLQIEVMQSDLFAAVAGRRFDLVVVNPPYFAKEPVDDTERAWFVGTDLGYFERFFAGLDDHLVEGALPGTCLMVLSEGCDIATISSAANRHGFVLESAVRVRVWLGIQVVWQIISASCGVTRKHVPRRSPIALFRLAESGGPFYEMRDS